MSHTPKYSNFAVNWVQSDEILPLSQPSSQSDEIKISSGVSQSHMGDELIEIVQYVVVPLAPNRRCGIVIYGR